MAKYFKQRLDGLGNGVTPPLEPVNGLRLMRRAPVQAIMRAQDYVTALSRRVVASGGLRGSETWYCPDTDPTDRAYPTPTQRRLIGAGNVDLTPGCFLRCWVTAVPSGACSDGTIDGDGNYADMGVHGRLEVDVVWTDRTGATVSTTHGVQLPASTNEFGAEMSPMWSHLYEYEIDIAPPGTVNIVQLRRWSQHVNIDVRIYATGGARVVDTCVFEYPHAVAMEADDDASYWTSHLYGFNRPSGPQTGLSHPYQRFSETTPDGDRRGGTWHMMDVHHAQHQRLGPVLFSWSGCRESDGSEAVTTASTSLVAIEGGGSTSWVLTEPGVPIGTGGYARRQSDNSEFVLRDRVAAIPVILRVLASSSGSNGTVRIQTRTDSFLEATVTSSSLAWRTAYGWLEVPITPDDTSRLVGQLFFEQASVAAVTLYYAGGYAPAA
jgi:hypothetical protein